MAPLSPEPSLTPIRDYAIVAPVYDLLAKIYSLGAIDRSRLLHLEKLASGARLLYPGGGTGHEAVVAAKRGHKVELWEPCAAMLQRAQQRRAKLDPDARKRLRLVQAPVQELPHNNRFDAIVCNYFLNLFSPLEQEWWLDRLAGHLAPGGRLWLADFAPLQGPLAPLQWIYHAQVLEVFRLLTGNAKHNPYDYRSILQEQGWRAIEEAHVRVGSIGPAWFRVWSALPPEHSGGASLPGASEAHS